MPEALTDDGERFPTIGAIATILGAARVEEISIRASSEDGFFEAYYARPEADLDPGLRAAQGVEQRALTAASKPTSPPGVWDARHGHLRPAHLRRPYAWT